MTFNDCDDLLSYYKSRIDFMNEGIAIRYLHLQIGCLTESIENLKYEIKKLKEDIEGK